MSAPAHKPLLSVCIPAHNEQDNIGDAIDVIAAALRAASVPFEFVIADDNSTDGTADVVRARMAQGVPITLVQRRPPGGFGRAVRSCFDHFHGDIVAVVMADLSDDPADIVRCYEVLRDGDYDAVFGSRFKKGSRVVDYPFVKCLANRLGNKVIQLLFWTRYNDLTNAFKVYRREALQSLQPLYASHFNLTIELSLGMLNRGFRIAEVPIAWHGRKKGLAKFNLRTLGRRYLATLMKALAERRFIHDDLMAEHNRTMARLHRHEHTEDRVTSNVEATEDPDHGRRGLRRVEPGG
ncbi:MAG: glycosyltransferase family 2 protein [Planctomycetota bacterium]